MQCPAAWTCKYCKLILSLNVLKISIWNILQRNKGEDWYFYMYSVTGHLLSPYVRKTSSGSQGKSFLFTGVQCKTVTMILSALSDQGNCHHVGKHTLCNWGGCPGVPILLHTKLIRTVFAQSLEVPCFNSAWAYRHSFPTLPPPPSTSDTPKAAAASQLPTGMTTSPWHYAGTTTRPPRLPATARSTWSSSPPTSACLPLPALTVTMWLWKTLPNIFSTNLMRRGNMLRNWWSCRTFLQDIKKPDHEDRENGLSATDCALHLEKSKHQSFLDLHKLATDKKDPRLCDCTETHYLNEPVKPRGEQGDHVTSLCGWGP